MIKLSIVPSAGLANRINCIMSAWELLKHYDADINIYWENATDCAADFDDLFTVIPPYGKDMVIHNKTPFHLKVPSKKNLHIPSMIRKLLFDEQYTTLEFRNVDLQEKMAKDISIYIYGYNRFCEYQRYSRIADVLKPVQDIQQKIDDIVSQYNDYTVGVHVRRTDNALAIQNNPMEKYYAYMDKEIAEHPQCNFYIATDSLDVKTELKGRYHDRIITGKWDLRRNSRQGIKDAVADLYCLGSCNKIIGSTNSTYSYLASILYDKPLIK